MAILGRVDVRAATGVFQPRVLSGRDCVRFLTEALALRGGARHRP